MLMRKLNIQINNSYHLLFILSQSIKWAVAVLNPLQLSLTPAKRLAPQEGSYTIPEILKLERFPKIKITAVWKSTRSQQNNRQIQQK